MTGTAERWRDTLVKLAVDLVAAVFWFQPLSGWHAVGSTPSKRWPPGCS